MREFLLHSRTGYTTPGFKSLMEGGRLDTVHQCAVMAIFKAAAHRQDVVFHAILNGPPSPPVHIRISSSELLNVRVDERSWEHLLKHVLSGRKHEGVEVNRVPFQKLVKEKHEAGYKIFILSAKGRDIKEEDLEGDVLFVLGDHVGLPKHDEDFALRYGSKLSLGKEKYLAASCIDIINYHLDRI